MSYELLYTSAPAGLKAGSRGFTTVVATKGLPGALYTRLETLSAYRHIFLPQDPRAADNPVAYSHLRLKSGGRAVSVLSRVAAYGVDYSGRTNKLAHHLVIDPAEHAPAGPAWLLAQPGLLKSQWDQNLKTPEAGPRIPLGDYPAAICRRWASIAGDAGWGGKLAEHFAKPSARPLWLLYSIDQRETLLGLIQEAIALLPPNDRWQATFTTYAMNLPPEVDCRLRCVPLEAPEARQVGPHNRLINLSQPDAFNESNKWIELARTGKVFSEPKPQVLKPQTPKPTPIVAPSRVSAKPTPTPPALSTPPPLDDEFRIQPPVFQTNHGMQTQELPPRIRRGTNAQHRQMGILKIVVAASAALLSAAIAVIAVIAIARPGSVKPITVVEGNSNSAQESSQSFDPPPDTDTGVATLDSPGQQSENANEDEEGNKGSGEEGGDADSPGQQSGNGNQGEYGNPRKEGEVNAPPIIDDLSAGSSNDRPAASSNELSAKPPNQEEDAFEFPIELEMKQIEDGYEITCNSEKKYLLAPSNTLPQGYKWTAENEEHQGKIADKEVKFSNDTSYLNFEIERNNSQKENWLKASYRLSSPSKMLGREKKLPCIQKEIDLVIALFKIQAGKVSTLRVDTSNNIEAPLFMDATKKINDVLHKIKDYSPSDKSTLTTDITDAIARIEKFCEQQIPQDKILWKDSSSKSELSFGQICDGLNKLKDALQQFINHDRLNCLELNLGTLILYAPSNGLTSSKIAEKKIRFRVIFTRLRSVESQASIR